MLEYIDYYKFTMGQMLFFELPDVSVEYTFKDRSGFLKLPGGLQLALNDIRRKGFELAELGYLQELGFSSGYVRYLAKNKLPRIFVRGNHISTWGPAPLASLWETIVLAMVNELIPLPRTHPYPEITGDQRLTQKIKQLKEYDGVGLIRFMDFGTRRRHTLAWHRHVLQRLMDEAPNHLMGTSNVGLARELGLRPMGSFAHEMPMIWAAIADLYNDGDIVGSHQDFLDSWIELYGGDSIALTDTFTTDFFFKNFENANSWAGLRHDSGDPFAFGDAALRFYREHGIAPHTKTLLFSDGLNVEMMRDLYRRFSKYVNVTFGWGTNLTNDVGLAPTNIVMKATGIMTQQGFRPTVKLSDDPGKHTGPADKVAQYQKLFGA